MPITNAKGDIFEIGVKEEIDLIVVFGHIGLNEMRYYWNRFRSTRPNLSEIRDPFPQGKTGNEQFMGYEDGKYIVFVSERQNHGMSDDDLKNALERILERGLKKKLKTVITNGIMDIDHGVDSAANANSNRNRVFFIRGVLGRYADKFENITLISLNDAYVSTPLV